MNWSQKSALAAPLSIKLSLALGIYAIAQFSVWNEDKKKFLYFFQKQSSVGIL